MTDETPARHAANLPASDHTGSVSHPEPAEQSEPVTGTAFHHPERDAVGTTWEPDWQPMETYREGDVVMLDDGERQLLGRQVMGMWMELTGGDELAQPDFQPMLWSLAPERVKYDLM